MAFSRLLFHAALAMLISLAEICRANEAELKSLNEQIKLKDPYGVLSDYLVSQRTSNSFDHNREVAEELMKEDNYEQLIESAEFKTMVKMLASLEHGFGGICGASNLANLRGLAAKMSQYNKRPTEGREARQRLNRLLIEFSQRAFFKCLGPLQDEWSEVNFEMVLMDEPSRRALAVMEAEVDFVQLIRSDYNPNLHNEHLFKRGLRCALENLHSKRMGAEQTLPGSLGEDAVTLGKHIDYYLVDSCAKMRARFGEPERRIIDKYLDLVTVAILMYPQVLGPQDERSNFASVRVKGAGRVVACNKLLGGANSRLLAERLLALARAESSIKTGAHVCKLPRVASS